MEPIQKQNILIKYVACYLRKSRGENEQDLLKHQTELKELCVKNNWKYVEYMEIESGDSIVMRPVMQRLLLDIENETYDAVCVVDIDRLGRGDLGDQDKIKKAFLKSNTLVVTPQCIYNLQNENDEFTIDMRSFIARMEYKQIVKRLLRGKKVGAKLGQWTNGSPPFPYEYERWKDKFNEKGLVVNDDKLKIYRYIIESVLLHRKNPHEIAWDLNTKKILSPRGMMWNGEVIRRMIIDETHFGKIISNKTEGDGHKIKKPNSKPVKLIPREQWVIIENCHEPVKTQQEHENILLFLHRKIKSPRKTDKEKKPLSDLIKCGICKHTMQVVHRPNRKTPDSVKPCWYKDAYGNKCPNRGGLAEGVYAAIDIAVKERKKELQEQIKINGSSEADKIQIKINEILKKITTAETTINFIYEQFEKGLYNEKMFLNRKDKSEKELQELENDLKIVQLELKYAQTLSTEDRLIRIEEYEKTDKKNLTPQQRNELYKTIIQDIQWTRQEEKAIINVNFL